MANPIPTIELFVSDILQQYDVVGKIPLAPRRKVSILDAGHEK